MDKPAKCSQQTYSLADSAMMMLQLVGRWEISCLRAVLIACSAMLSFIPALSVRFLPRH